MKIDGNTIRPGMAIEHQGRLWRAVKVQHVKPGKGGAFMQVELKDIRSGSKLNERFRASESVERARLDEKQFQFLFADDSEYTFMDCESYEQITLGIGLIDETQSRYLQDGMLVTIEFHEGNPIGVMMPEKAVLVVAEADAVVKGQTQSSSYKPAVLENGVKIMVPPYIEPGTRVVVNTADDTYAERAKD